LIVIPDIDSSMERDSEEHFLESRYALWLIATLAILLCLITNLPWNLDDYDQAKQAFTSFEMVKEGHWLYQRTARERAATKPPLVGWISAGVFGLTRSWDIAWRLPSFLAAGALALYLFRGASSAYRATAGLIALSAFSFNLLTPRLATLVRTDMPLALVIFLIGLTIWQKIRQNKPWNFRDRSWMFALLTAGMLIKGPIIYAFVLPGLAVFQCWRRNTGASAWPGWWPWIASLGVFLLWVIGGAKFVPGFFDQVVMREFLGRFGTTVHHPKAFYFYWPHLLHKFAPWSVLIIVLALVARGSARAKVATSSKSVDSAPSSPIGRGTEGEGNRGGRNEGTTRSRYRKFFTNISPDMFWLMCWSLGGLIVMSFIPSKRVDRIFPVVPPLCLLLAAQVARPPLGGQSRQWFYRYSAAALLLSMLFTGCYSGFKIISGYRDHRDALVRFGKAVRNAAAQHRWRYEVTPANDEGMLLYLQKTHFTRPERAIADWNQGNLDGLVVPVEQAVSYLGALRHATLSPLQSTEKKDERGKGYLLLTRDTPSTRD
jgi:4-amino-4-deoxy-L-arabinose transferase-like glycosyltransferase